MISNRSRNVANLGHVDDQLAFVAVLVFGRGSMVTPILEVIWEYRIRMQIQCDGPRQEASFGAKEHGWPHLFLLCRGARQAQ